MHGHHAEHLARVLAATAEAPCCTAELLAVLFTRQLDVPQTSFAMGKAIAHLQKLWKDGGLPRPHDGGVPTASR